MGTQDGLPADFLNIRVIFSSTPQLEEQRETGCFFPHTASLITSALHDLAMARRTTSSKP
jgi:hypothetical protein